MLVVLATWSLTYLDSLIYYVLNYERHNLIITSTVICYFKNRQLPFILKLSVKVFFCRFQSATFFCFLQRKHMLGKAEMLWKSDNFRIGIPLIIRKYRHTVEYTGIMTYIHSRYSHKSSPPCLCDCMCALMLGLVLFLSC